MTPFKIILGCVLFDVLQLFVWIVRMQASNFASGERNPRNRDDVARTEFTRATDSPDSISPEFSSSPQSS